MLKPVLVALFALPAAILCVTWLLVNSHNEYEEHTGYFTRPINAKPYLLGMLTMLTCAFIVYFTM